MKIRTIVLIFASLLLLNTSCNKKTSQGNNNIEEQKTESVMKGVWVTNVASDALFSRDKINETVQICKKSGITDIYVVTWNGGYTLYPSKIMSEELGIPIMKRFEGRDPLKEIIEEGHKNGIKVHAWFEFGFASSHRDSTGGPLLRKHPEWKAIDNEGNLVSKNDFQWMNAINPEVQNFVKSLVLEVVQNYDVDGVQGDDRLPAMPSLGGYDSYTISLYKKEHNDSIPPQDYKDPDWLTWRANKLTDFLGTLYKDVKAIKPDMIVSMAPSIHPWAKEEYLQDWPAWLEKGYCDYVIPQVYRYSIDNYTKTLESQMSYLKDNQKEKFYSGVLLQVDDFNPSLGFLDSMIVANRANGIKGEAFFFFEGLKKYPDYFTKQYITK